MPKKIKKPISRKPKQKNKNVVNVKINIDNSKKTTARRTPMKPSNMQPFVNFPSFQPTRIQQLEPLKKYNNGDLTKADDMYQKQFKNYLETTDKTVKDLIEKFDDTLKKNTAPQKTEESKPGASNVYADTEGTTVFTEPIAKDNINMPPQKQGFQNWSKPNEIKENVLTATISPPLQSNQLQEVLTEAVEGKALNRVDLKDFLKNSSKVQFNRVVKSMTPEQIEKVLKKATMEQIEKVLEKAEPKQKLKINNVLTSQETKKIEKVVKPKVLKTKIVKTNKSTELKEIDKIKKELDDKLKQVEVDKVLAFVKANITPQKESSIVPVKPPEPVKPPKPVKPTENKKPRGRPPGTGKVKSMVKTINEKTNKSK